MSDLLAALLVVAAVCAWTYLATVDWIHPGTHTPAPERTGT